MAGGVAAAFSTFGLAWFSFWPAILLGLGLGLNPLLVIILTSVSYMSGVLLLILLGEPVRKWFIKRFLKEDQLSDPNGRARQILDRYGVIGLGLLGPMTVGAQMVAIIGVSLNVPPRKLLIWSIIGAILWSSGLTLLASLGILGAQELLT